MLIIPLRIREKENFDFSEPYYTDTTMVMVEDSSMFEDMEELADQNIGSGQEYKCRPAACGKIIC